MSYLLSLQASGGSSVLQHRRPSGGVELNHGRMTSFGPYQPDSLPHRQSQGTVHWGETPALSVHRQSGVGELQGRASSVHRQSGGLGDLQSRASRRGEMQSSLSGGGGLQRRPSVGESSFRGPSSKSSLTGKNVALCRCLQQNSLYVWQCVQAALCACISVFAHISVKLMHKHLSKAFTLR